MMVNCQNCHSQHPLVGGCENLISLFSFLFSSILLFKTRKRLFLYKRRLDRKEPLFFSLFFFHFHFNIFYTFSRLGWPSTLSFLIVLYILFFLVILLFINILWRCRVFYLNVVFFFVAISTYFYCYHRILSSQVKIKCCQSFLLENCTKTGSLTSCLCSKISNQITVRYLYRTSMTDKC